MRRKTLLLTVALGALVSPAAHAQAAGPDGAHASREAPADIIVTAEKRSANIQDVPVAITVISADALAKTGATSFTDLTRLAPSMTYQEGGNPAVSTISLRGVGTFAYSIGVESSVLVMVDDVALAQQAQALSDLVDIERVEVLRGPQSTLFGKSASAGVVSVTTRDPSDRVTAKASVMITDDNEQRYSVSLSGPITDTLGLRVSGALGRWEGNVYNVASGKLLNGRDTDSVRGKLRWEPSAGVDFTLSGHYSRMGSNCCASILRSVSPDARLLAVSSLTLDKFAPGITPGPNNTMVSYGDEPVANSRDRGGSLKANIMIGDHQLTSVTAYNHYSLADAAETDMSAIDVLTLLTRGFASGGISQSGSYDTKAFSQELRLTSPKGPFSYVAGLYYANNDLARTFRRGPFVSVAGFNAKSKSKSYAVFGQTDWRFLSNTSLIAGLRVNREDISYQFTNTVTNKSFSGSDSDMAVTGKVGLQHYLSDDIMLFATYSRGYKGQAYDLTSSFNAAVSARQPVKAEHANNYEVGVKSAFFDRRIILNLTAFNTDYSNFQAQALEPTLGGALILDNVGSLRTRGVEAEILARPSSAFTLSGGLTYTDAKIRSYPAAQCYAGQTEALGCVNGSQDLSGASLSNSPRWKANVLAGYRVDLPSLPFDADLSLGYSWQSKVQYQLSQDPNTIQGAYGIANASITFIERENKHYSVSVFARNLFNQHYAAGLYNFTQVYRAPVITHWIGRDFERFLGVNVTVSY